LGIGFAGVSLASGLTVLTMAYAFGHVSGCHLNPAVSLGLFIGGRFKAKDLLPYIVAQVAAPVRKLGGARKLVGALYPGVSDERQLGREVARDAVFTAFARRIAYLHSRKALTWRYYFTGTNADGVVHGGEVPYVLGTRDTCQCLGRPVRPLDRTLERRMSERWAAFVGIHSPAGETVWPQDNRRPGQVLEMGERDTVGPRFMAARINAMIVALNFAGRKKKRD
jgi:para-nitrobenzyl esterase